MRAGDPPEFGEFVIVGKYRSGGVGTVAANKAFLEFPGPWLVHGPAGNDSAVACWRHAIPV